MYDLRLIVVVSCSFLVFSRATEQVPCQLREYDKGEFVCVCNATLCDALNVERPMSFGEFVLISSTADGKRFHVSKGDAIIGDIPKGPSVVRIHRRSTWPIFDSESEKLQTIDLSIDTDRKYQKIVGFGGAFTGSVSHLLDQMPAELRRTLYTSYYSSADGIGYTMMRIPIGGCDFDLAPWAYNEQPENDQALSNFTRLDERDRQRIAQLRDLEAASQNHNIKLIGAAWSPPPWMKTNNRWNGASSLKSEYYQTWADYHVRYLELMSKENVKFWAISTGNEPLNGVIGWVFVHFMSLGWTADNQAKWVAENLGPTLRRSEFKDVKLFAGDDQRYSFPWWFERMHNSVPASMEYVDGFAVHWYWDKIAPVSLIEDAHRAFPDKIILGTEASSGDKPFQAHRPVLGSWSRAEDYAHSIIEDLEHSVSGWIDWNLILDDTGGPNYVDNTVDAAVVLNSTTHSEFYRQPIFYVMAHFSKFIAPDSVRVDAKLSHGSVRTVAFLCPDNTMTVILFNGSKEPKNIHYTDDSRGTYEFEIQAKSINTFILA